MNRDDSTRCATENVLKSLYAMYVNKDGEVVFKRLPQGGQDNE